MSIMKKYLWLTAISLICCLCVLVFTSPSIESVWVVFGYFTTLFLFAFFGSSFVLMFLNLKKQLRLRSLIFAGSIVLIQVLATFKALRLVELFLITATIVVFTWYVSGLKQR